ncbi:phosphotransferase [Brevibacillus formosus]|uniref:phosphotransferase n=1 Tax=Brevibacillus formosus TaxID=54913 RepID=UPI001F3F1808|nr:phosphotransferase [Brevibacillus formosus]MED1958767.1 phosphotransferase [Brevibacillus formosus]
MAIHLLRLSLRSDLRLESSEKIAYDPFIEWGEHVRLNQLSDTCTFVIESGRDGNCLLRIHANKNRNHYGIIHGDLYQGNIIFHNGDPRSIDFGRCGFGYYLYDIAHTILGLYPSQRELVIKGYESLRKLEGDWLKTT